jgi:hypothetical protein
VRFESYAFGSLTIDGVTYDYDVVIDRGSISKRSKALEAVPGRVRAHAAFRR